VSECELSELRAGRCAAGQCELYGALGGRVALVGRSFVRSLFGFDGRTDWRLAARTLAAGRSQPSPSPTLTHSLTRSLAHSLAHSLTHFHSLSINFPALSLALTQLTHGVEVSGCADRFRRRVAGNVVFADSFREKGLAIWPRNCRYPGQSVRACPDMSGTQTCFGDDLQHVCSAHAPLRRYGAPRLRAIARHHAPRKLRQDQDRSRSEIPDKEDTRACACMCACVRARTYQLNLGSQWSTPTQSLIRPGATCTNGQPLNHSDTTVINTTREPP